MNKNILDEGIERESLIRKHLEKLIDLEEQKTNLLKIISNIENRMVEEKEKINALKLLRKKKDEQ